MKKAKFEFSNPSNRDATIDYISRNYPGLCATAAGSNLLFVQALNSTLFAVNLATDLEKNCGAKFLGSVNPRSV